MNKAEEGKMSGGNRARRIAALLFLLGLFCAPGLRAGTPTAEKDDPFAELRKDVTRAVDSQLGQVEENFLRAVLETPRSEKERLWSALRPPPESLAGVARDHGDTPQQRLLALGVDAARIFAEEGVPTQFVVLAGVESGFNPAALSRKSARGLWQLMPETAARFGLRVDARVDERTHPVRSTRAAARYLRQLYEQFEDWVLALAAYNAGEGRVSRAMERGRTRSFWELASRGFLPQETRQYVPAVLARLGSK